MPSKRSNERPPKLLPTLTVGMEEAQKQIESQVAKGREIRSRNITTPTLLAEARADEQRWTDYNKSLLLRLFDDDAFWRDYDSTYLGVIHLSMYGPPSLSEQIKTLHDGLDKRINKLISIQDRLPLTVPSGTNPAPPVEAHQSSRTVPLISIQHSPQAHVTVHGTDASVSRLNQETVFTEMRRAVEQNVHAPDRARLLEKIAELEAVKHKPGFLERYKEFVGLAAAHMEIIAPFIPALTQWLG